MNTTSESMTITMKEGRTTSANQLKRNVGVMLAVLGIWMVTFWPTFRDMAQLWLRSGTFAHGLVVLPISAYLIWTRREPLGAVVAKPAWGVLLPLALVILAWCAGVAFSIASLEHFAGTAVLVVALWLCLGHQVFRTITFPLCFLMFMAPVGDFLVPTFMDFTADFTVTALRATGVPVFQEGHHFVLPNGRWSVVEACSGIRYLIASLMVGTLYAYLNYRSFKRRALFAVVALVVPIIANWLRAYMIVLIGYLSDNELAVGVDHLLYGWVFFGIVIALMFWIGNRWAEPAGDDAELRQTTIRPQGAGALIAGLVVSLTMLAVTAWAGYGLRPTNSDLSLPIQPIVPADGWISKPDATGFRPDFSGYRGELSSVFLHGGQELNLYVSVYSDQAPGHEMVAWSNKLWPSRKTWRIVEEGADTLPVGRVHYARLIGPEGAVFHLWHWYRIGDQVEDNDYLATLRIAWRRLRSGVDDGAHIVIAVPAEDKLSARALVSSFIADNEAGLDRVITDAYGVKE